MSEEEVAMAAQEARTRNKVLSAHARSSGSVKQCIRHGIQNIYHASFADEEALDMLEAAKDRHFVAPGIAWLINTARHAEQWGIKPGSPLTMEYERELEMCVETMKKMHRRGIRVCIGGDYGFAWTPQGTNAKDIADLRRDARLLADGGDPRRRPNMAARSWAWATSSARSRRATSPTSCSSTAIRSPMSASCRRRTGCSRS